ncbi:MAG: AsmA family protein, partial [Stellaceae bacterium]
HLVGAPLDLGFKGSVTGMPPTKLSGNVDLSVPSVRGLATWAGTPLPPGPGLQKLAIKGRIDKTGPKLAFSNAAIALDAITGKGSVAVTTGGARPVLTGALTLDRLDLNPYLPAARTGAAPAPSAKRGAGTHAAPKPAAEGWSDAPIDLAGLRRLDSDFDLKAAAILYRKIEIGPSALDLHLKGGKLTANLTQLSLYQGSGKGTLSVDGSGAAPELAMDFALRGVAVGPLLAASAGPDRLEGTGNVDFTVAGSGKSERALVSALDGKGAFNLANGKLKGANLIALAENSTTAVTGANAENATSFGSLTGTFTIKNGVLKNEDLQLKSGVIPITGAGTVSLPSRRLDYRVTVSLAGAIGVPVMVTGPWDDISYRPDLAGALKGVVKTPGNVLDQLRGLGGKAGTGSNPADLLKGLLGR